MKNLSVQTQGPKGGNTKTVNNVGYILAISGDQRISIDSFEGSGATYKQRESAKIELIENGKVLFSGSF